MSFLFWLPPGHSPYTARVCFLSRLKASPGSFLILDVLAATFVWSLCSRVSALILAWVSFFSAWVPPLSLSFVWLLLLVGAILSAGVALAPRHTPSPTLYALGSTCWVPCIHWLSILNPPTLLDPEPWQPGFQAFQTPPQGAYIPTFMLNKCLFMWTFQGNNTYQWGFS